MEAVLIDVKLALSRSLRERRNKQGLSQVQLAERLQSSQSRVAKMEAGDPSVSMDLLVSALLLLGASSTDLANAIRGGPAPLPRTHQSAHRRRSDELSSETALDFLATTLGEKWGGGRDRMSQFLLVFRVHAIQRMFQRRISREDVRLVVATGETIETYSD